MDDNLKEKCLNSEAEQEVLLHHDVKQEIADIDMHKENEYKELYEEIKSEIKCEQNQTDRSFLKNQDDCKNVNSSVEISFENVDIKQEIENEDMYDENVYDQFNGDITSEIKIEDYKIESSILEDNDEELIMDNENRNEDKNDSPNKDICHICQKTFRSKRNLEVHIKYHFGEGMKKKFSCDICNERFAQKSDWYNHSLGHREEKSFQFQCPVCCKRFLKNMNLNRHLISHSDVQLFTCSYCKQLFVDRTLWLEHENEHNKVRCEMPEINLLSLNKLCEDKAALLVQLQEWNLIPRSLQCPKCGSNLKLGEDKSRIDSWIWRCRNKFSRSKKKVRLCTYMSSIRTGTIFSRSKLTIFQVLALVNLWVENSQEQLICDKLELGRTTCIEWVWICRQILLTHYLGNVTKLGGPGKVVEIYQSQLDRSKTYRSQWIFSLFERGSGRVCMKPMRDRDADTLIPLIIELIEPGTTIMSDFWKDYDCLHRSGYINLKINNSLIYANQDITDHTSLESTWRGAKSCASSTGRRRAPLPSNLARYMFYKQCSELGLNRTAEFYRIAGVNYSSEPDALKYDGDEINPKNMEL